MSPRAHPTPGAGPRGGARTGARTGAGPRPPRQGPGPGQGGSVAQAKAPTTTAQAGRLGGLATRARLSPQERHRVASNAARARWGRRPARPAQGQARAKKGPQVPTPQPGAKGPGQRPGPGTGQGSSQSRAQAEAGPQSGPHSKARPSAAKGGRSPSPGTRQGTSQASGGPHSESEHLLPPSTGHSPAQVSRCCHAPAEVRGDLEGTSYYVCGKCGQATDLWGFCLPVPA